MKTDMRRWGVFFVPVALFLILFSSVAQGQVTYSIHFNFDQVNFKAIDAKDGHTYDKVEYADIAATDDWGKPLLPVKYVKLIVPANEDVDSIELKHIEQRELAVTALILPAQKPLPTAIDPPEEPFITPDPQVYESDNFYPEEAVMVAHDGFFDGVNHIITVAIYPLQYRPKSGLLAFYSYIDFEVKMKASDQIRVQGGVRTPENQAVYNAILHKVVDNPQDIGRYRKQPALGKLTAVQVNPLPSYEYVIITTNALKDYLNAFAAWKARKGLNVGIVTMEQILANYNSDTISGIADNAGALRQYLADSYNTGSPKTMWALLVGDHTIVPVRYGAGYSGCSWATYSYYKIPADLYFSDFNGDWDVDSDVRYGEPSNDAPDYNPEIFVGRVPATDSTDISNWIEKILKYELNPGNGVDGYLRKAFWVSEDMMINQPDVVSPDYPSSFSGKHTMYKADHPANEVVQEMSNHYGLLNWYCHGNVNSFSAFRSNPSSRMVWTTDDGSLYDLSDVLQTSGIAGDGLDNMTNVDFPAVIYSICCETCAFDDFRTTSRPDTIPNDGNTYPLGQRSMPEGYMTATNKICGPIKLGNTRYGYVYSSYQLHQEFCDLWANGITDAGSGQTSYHGGVAEAVSKQNYSDHYLRYSHNLFGCPETNIWTDSLAAFTNVSITDNGTSISVNANVAGSNICACSGNNGASFFQLYSNVSSCSFSTSVRPLYLTITKHNFAPYIALTGGTFSSNEYWFEHLYVRGDVTVNSGYTLTVMKGAKITFATNDDRSGGINTTKCELIVNGTLKADSATFIGPTKGSWCAIRFTSTASSNCKLEKCTIENAQTGVYISGSDPTIRQCNIKTCSDWGIYVTGSGASPVIDDNYIQADRIGLYYYNANGSSGDISRNSFRTDSTGFYSTSGSPWFEFSGQDGLNKWESSVLHNRVLVDGGTPILGDEQGYNYFTKPSSSTYKYINNNTGSTVFALGNYFDQCPNPDTNWFSGPVNRNGKLAAPPSSPAAGPSWSLPKANTDFLARLKSIRRHIAAGETTIAKTELTALTEEYKGDELSIYAYDLLLGIAMNDEEQTMQTLTCLYDKDENACTNLKFMGDKWKVIQAGKQGRLQPGREMLDKYQGTAFGREMTLVYAAALAENGQKDNAIVLVNELRKEETDSPEIAESLTKSIALQMTEIGERSPEIMNVVDNQVPLLASAYPNPFNSNTKLILNLEQSGHVVLTIYNILGHRIVTLVDGTLTKGRHEIVWDGRNELGQTAASGLYFCRFMAGEKKQTVKILLAK
ncbi:MAG TPA: C25 family cysteine peptidase [bacterium]|nr:C25 family cysteine peptidase [bacterium]